MNLEEVVYKTFPLTLFDHITAQRAARGDFEAMLAFILARTNLTESDALKMDDEDCIHVVNHINAAVDQGIVLRKLAKSFDDKQV